jgi:hypothetical protein
MMTRLAAVLALVVALCACSSGTIPPPPAATTAPASAAAAPASDTSARGNKVMRLGQRAWDDCPTTDPADCGLEFALEKITECGGPPADGVRRVLRWRATTRPHYRPDVPNPINVFYLRHVGSDGVYRAVVPDDPADCVLIRDLFPDGKQLQPGTTYVGGVEVVLPEPTGTLVLALPGHSSGWEWPLTP